MPIVGFGSLNVCCLFVKSDRMTQKQSTADLWPIMTKSQHVLLLHLYFILKHEKVSTPSEKLVLIIFYFYVPVGEHIFVCR